MRIGEPRTRPNGWSACPRRRRVVIVVERDGSRRWSEATGAAAPLELDELPLRADLLDELRELDSKWRATLADDHDGEAFFLGDWAIDDLECRGRAIWRRIRSGLGAEFCIGWKPPHAARPIYAEDSGSGPNDDYLPF
jgi:hypothetical protein